MPTLYVENVPLDLYEALRARATQNRTSIAAEVLGLLAESVPTPAELSRRRQFLEEARKIRSRRKLSRGPFPSAEQVQREERAG